MAATSETTWSDILAHVRLNHPDLVRGWFADIERPQIAEGIVSIAVRNHAQADYLRQHCHAAFLEAAQAATGRLVTVAFDTCRTGLDNEAPAPPSQPMQDQLPLNPDYTFNHFVTGPCNRLAHAAALAVADDPGRAYNPFFVYGATGLGKTHLLQAVSHRIQGNQPAAACLYLSCETFINHFIEAVERGAIHQFRYRYRHADVLVIDDIQFLAERERSQEEFFHTFNTLHQSHRQIILSADCSPAEIPSLEERLVSRFSSGLVVLLDRPCLETRMTIVRKKAKLRCIELPDEVVHFVASRLDTNIRDIEGALLKIDAISQTTGGVITLTTARQALGSAPTRPVSIPTIIEAVASRLHVKVTDLQGRKRSRAVTFPRHVCMYLARQLTARSLEEIGGYFGGRDHTTVLHASRTIARQADTDPPTARLLDELTLALKDGAG